MIESFGETSTVPSMHFFRGCAYCRMQDFTAAVEDFTIGVELRPDDLEGYVRRAIAYWSLQDWDLSLLDMNTAIELQPSSPRLYALRGRLQCCLRNWKDASMDYKRAIAIAKGSDEVCERAVQGLAECQIKHEPLPLI